MKSIYVLLLAAALVAGCRGKHSRTAIEHEEPEGRREVTSSLKMNDPSAASQLVRGFYGIEGNAWRWTAGKFSLTLKPPPASNQNGAMLRFAFTIPDVIAQKVGTVKLTASTAGTELKTETYTKPGSYTFTADVPASALTKDTITIDFALDKAMPPGPADGRELGLIAASAGLESK